MADPHKALGQDVKQEAADELGGLQSHDAWSLLMTVVSAAEADLVGLTGEQALVGDGHPVGIASQVLQHLLWTPKRRFRVDDPIAFLELLEMSVPELGIREVPKLTVEGKFSQPIGLL